MADGIGAKPYKQVCIFTSEGALLNFQVDYQYDTHHFLIGFFVNLGYYDLPILVVGIGEYLLFFKYEKFRIDNVSEKRIFHSNYHSEGW